jgi:molybdate/tungstate transport system ATP-binding protein
VIAVENVTIRQGEFVLTGIGFQVPKGEYAVLMGKTGSGKTTLLEAICGLRPIAAPGRILLMGHDVTRLKPAERGIGYVPQDGALFPTMTVREHLAFALRIRHWERRRIEDTVREIAAMLGVEQLLERKPTGLSGGEAQRVALGRALSFHPGALLLDEPLSALDDATREDMYELLRTVRRRTGVTALHVTHSVTEARALGDRIFVLEDGQVTAAPLAGRLE